VRNIEKYGPKIGVLAGKNFNPNTQTPRKSIPTETRYLAQKNGVDPLKNVVSKSGQEILFKKLKNNPN